MKALIVVVLLLIGSVFCTNVAQLRTPITITNLKEGECSAVTLSFKGDCATKTQSDIQTLSSSIKSKFHIEASEEESDIFNQPRANLVLLVDALGQNNIPELQNLQIMGSANTQRKCSFGNTLTQLTTALTGASPKEHGIVSARWISQSCEEQQAFTSEETYADVQTVADEFASNFEGRPLILSASANTLLAKASSAHPITVSQVAEHVKTFSFKDGEFSSQDSKCKLGNKADVIEKLASFVPSLESESVQITFDAATKVVRVRVPAKNIDASFAMANEEDFILFGELYMFDALVKYLNNPAVQSLVKDDTPDFFSFTISTLRTIGDKYGFRSAQYFAAVHIVDAFVSKIAAKFAAVYDNNSAAQVALLGRDVELSSAQKQALSLVKELLKNELVDKTSVVKFLPNLYLKSEASESQCAELKSILSAVDLEVNCAADAPATTGRKLLHWSSRVAKPDAHHVLTRGNTLAYNVAPKLSFQVNTVNVTNNNSTSDVNGITISEYQVSLWAALGFIFLVMAAVYGLNSIDYTHDSLLMSNDGGKDF